MDNINIYKLHADVCKTFSNYRRLQIVEYLGKVSNCTASELVNKLKINKVSLSQHMGILVEQGVVGAKRNGVNVIYNLTDSRITKACNLMREVLISRLEKQSNIFNKLTKMEEKK